MLWGCPHLPTSAQLLGYSGCTQHCIFPDKLDLFAAMRHNGAEKLHFGEGPLGSIASGSFPRSEEKQISLLL